MTKRSDGSDADRDRTATAPLGADASQAGEVQAATSGGAWLFAPGQLLAGRYRVRAFIARGGMGEVYEVFDERGGTAVALKALLPAGDPVRREERLTREVVLARQVTHPNVCRVHDVGHENAAGTVGVSVPFVTMELLRGDTLAAHLADAGALPLERVTGIVEQLAAGLDAAHAAGVVHRDFKPHNVILVPDRDGDGTRVVITDFGLARAISAEHGTVVTTDFAGTPQYMAPEQVLDQPVTPATDVYALGLTIFEMVTGKRPFAAESPFAVAMQRVQADAPRARTLVPELDARWDAAIARCLSRDPAHRFGRACEVVAALRADVPVAVVSLPASRSATTRRRRWIPVALGGAVAVAFGAFVLAGSLRQATRAAPLGTFERYAGGDVAMMQTFGGAREADVRHLAAGGDGDVYVVGRAAATIQIGGRSLAFRDFRWSGFAARLAPDGAARWAVGVRGSHDCLLAGSALAGDDVVVIGTRSGSVDLGGAVALGSPAGVSGCFVAALDSAGAPRWIRDCGGTHEGGSVAVADSVIYTVAVSTETTAASVEAGVALMAWSLDGRLRWQRTFPVHGWNEGARLAVHGDTLVLATTLIGTTVLGATTLTSRGRSDIMVAALDAADGSPRWARTFGGDESDSSSDVTLLGDGRIALSGRYVGSIELVPGQRRTSRGGGDLFVAVLGAGGEVEHTWFGGTAGVDHELSVQAAGDELLAAGVVVRGFSGDEIDPIDRQTAFVARFDHRLHVLGVQSFGDVDGVSPTVAVVAPEGALTIGGSFQYRLRAEQHFATAPARDGFLLTFRRPGPPP